MHTTYNQCDTPLVVTTEFADVLISLLFLSHSWHPMPLATFQRALRLWENM